MFAFRRFWVGSSWGGLAKDFPLVQGTVLFVAAAYVLINVLVDVAYAVLDPRIRVG